MADKDVMTKLFLSSYNDVRRFIKRIVRSDETANELAHETFLKTMEYSGELESPRAFLFTAAKNLAFDCRRHERKVIFESRENFDDVLITDELPEDLLIAVERAELLHKALDRLPKKCKAVYIGRAFYGLSYQQLSKKYGISVKTVEHHIAFGLRETAGILKRIKASQLKVK